MIPHSYNCLYMPEFANTYIHIHAEKEGAGGGERPSNYKCFYNTNNIQNVNLFQYDKKVHYV